MIYENFISYKRKNSKIEVKTIYDELIKKGLSTFCDVYSLGSCDFNEELKQKIATCTNFLLVLKTGSLDNINNEDWMYKEIYEALSKQKNIICIFLDDFKFPNNLPSEIDCIRYKNGVKYSLEYFDSFMNKLVSQFLIDINSWKISNENTDFVIENNKLIKYIGYSKIVNIPNNVSTIGNYAFKDRTDIEKISFPNSLQCIEENAFERCLNLTSLKFPNSLKTIQSRAFKRCFNLTYIQFGDGIEEVLSEAFAFCAKLKIIELPASLLHIDSSAFNSCPKLSYINIDSNNKFYYSADGILYTKDLSTIIRCPEGYRDDFIKILPQTTTIKDYCFSQCLNIVNIFIPNTIHSIGKYAFKDCINLSSLSLDDNIIEIDISAFDGWGKGQKIIYSKNFNQLMKYNIENKIKGNLLNNNIEKNDEFVLIKTTFESEEEAVNMASILLDKHYIVSGQLSRLRSIYYWDKKINCENEIELSCITKSNMIEKIKQFIIEKHSYEVCEFICIPILETTAAFADRISDYISID